MKYPKLSRLPFFNGSSEKSDNRGFPKVLPLELYYDSRLELVRLANEPRTESYLTQLYKSGTLADGSISNESGAIYTEEILKYIRDWGLTSGVESALEIGCGYGGILAGLENSGLKRLVGIEPGNYEKFLPSSSVELITSFYPNDSNEKFDLVMHFAVWEHFSDPEKFLRDCLDSLTPDGYIIFGVPNCEPYLELGDPSIILHEHYSYFTKQSIYALSETCGAHVVDLSLVHGLLVGVLRRGRTDLKSNDKLSAVSNSKDRFLALYLERIARNVCALENFFAGAEKGTTVAIYVPTRAINILFLTTNPPKLRLVDDNPEIQGRFLPGLDNPVESFEAICNDPPDRIVIFSATFFEAIRDKCRRAKELQHTVTVSADSIFDA